MKFLLFIVPLISIFINIKAKSPYNPLSVCTKARMTRYTMYVNGGSCSFGPHPNAEGPTYMYPLSPNQAFYNNQAQCGICYEVTGPKGTIRGRVENYCQANDENHVCGGDMYHFDIAHPGAQYLMEGAGLANITFRMVACDFNSNIKIKSSKDALTGWYNFVVLDHKIGIKSVRAQENGSSKWMELPRENSNQWTVHPGGRDIVFPLKIEIYSINNDYVTVIVPQYAKETIYEADGNFKVPEDLFFDVEKLVPVKKRTDCNDECELDRNDFSPIYQDGIINGGYEHHEQKSNVNYKSTDSKKGNYSINVKFQSFGRLIFKSVFPINANLYSGVKFTLKAKEKCNECLFVRAYDLTNNNKKLSFSEGEVGQWKDYSFSFEELGVNGVFNGFIFQYYLSTDKEIEYQIDSVEVIPNSKAPKMDACFHNPELDTKEGDKDNGGNDGMSGFAVFLIVLLVIVIIGGALFALYKFTPLFKKIEVLINKNNKTGALMEML